MGIIMTPTPKEKAKKLFEKFYSVSNPQGLNLITHDEAKNCALISVDEISQVVKMCIPYLNKETYISYWDEVKTEIEAL